MRANQELRDIAVFSVGFFFLLFVWVFFLGWLPGLSVANNDALSFHYPYVEKLIEMKGAWTRLRYDPGWMGGVRLHGSYGTPPLLALLSFFLKSPISVLNLYMFLQQTLLGFYAAKSFELTVPISTDQSRFFKAGVFLLAAFSPIWAWRIFSGQMNPSLLILPALIPLALGLSDPRFGVIAFLFSLAGLVNGVAYINYHFDLYAFIFGFPVLLALLYDLRRLDRKKFFLLAALAIAVLVFTVPHWLEPLLFFGSGEAARQAGQGSVFDSFGLTGWRDWLSSLAWSRVFIPSGHPIEYAHEFNYPMGPLLLGVFLARGYRTTRFAMAFSLGIAAAFGSGLWPVSAILINLIPVLGSFRCPARAAIFPLLFLPLISGLFLQEGKNNVFRKRDVFFTLVSVFGVFLIPGMGKELFLWIALLFFYVARVPRVAITLLFVLGSLLAFRERIELADFTREEPSLRLMRESSLRALPTLASPFERVVLLNRSPYLGNNLSTGIGLGSIDGYWMPLAVHLQWLRSMTPDGAIPFDAMSFRHNASLPEFARIASLFNVRHLLEFSPDYSLRILKEFPTRGAVWITGSPSCDAEKVQPSLSLIERYFLAEIGLSAPMKEPCILVLSTNYSPSLRAIAEGRELETLPVEGILLGVRVPAGVRTITVSADDLSARLFWPAYLGGTLLLYWIWRQRRKLIS